MLSNLTRLVVMPAILVALVGCQDRDLRPLNPCTISGVAETVRVDNIENVDLLFMMDNSNSMSEEQVAIAREIPNLVRTLASGDIADPATGLPDGEQDFPPVRSLHVGVVTSDMGTGGFLVPTCAESNFGGDGILRTQGNVSISGCMATFPSFLEFRPADGGDPTAFASDVECVAVLGTNGCGFEQQLEATLKALTPSSSSITFGMGTVGHADGANNGFLRDDSLLTVIMVTDEDDCSASDPDLFNPSSTRYSGDLNLRCFQFPEAVHPVERFSEGLLATRQDRNLLVFAAITGIPEAINPSPDTPTDYAGILSNDLMQEMVDPAMPTRLRPSCNRPGTGIAFPPRRIVSVAQQLDAGGATAIVQTICQDSYAAAIQAVINRIADVLGGTCLPRSLNRDATGLVNCDVVEVLPAEGETTTCTGIPGREFLRMEADDVGNMVEVCRVAQLAQDRIDSGDPGWFYDDFSADVMDRCPPERPQRISFTRSPATGTLVRLECLQTVGDTSGMVGIGSSCAADCSMANGRRDIMEQFPMGLACEPVSQTCQPQCANDADCAGGFTCFDGDGDGQSFCVNPTCANM
ncbi:MAG: hypothetical protein AAGE52_20490 [Myxococcota bacterium]